MVKAWLLFSFAVTLSAACGSVGASAARPPNPELALAVSAHRARFLAMTRGDLAALDTLLADDAIYVHTSGRVETKAQFMESLRSRRLVYESIEVTEAQMRWLAPSVAVVAGQARMRVTVADAKQEFDIRFTDVLAERGGRWQTVVWQSTRLPGS